MAEVKEQQICINCGFCCDGTLFHNANLEPGEKGNLPDYMEKSYFKNEKGEFFKLPCEYFDGKCTIYDQPKAIICGAFRCQLLKDFAAKKISQKAALEIVKKSKITRDELFEAYARLTGKRGKITVRQLLVELGKLQKETNGLNMEFELFTARCNIFEALLLRYFKSENDFNSMKANLHEDDLNEKQ